MNNCEKCGNPLQPGLTTCPICGTTAKSLDAAVTAQPMVNDQIEALDEPPIASAPLIDPNVPVTPPTVDMVAPTGTPINPAQPMDIPAAPSTPVPLPEGTPSFEAPTQAVSQPAMQTEPAQPAMFTDTGFTGMGINAATPASGPLLDVPATQQVPAPSTPPPAEKKEVAPKKEKKSNNILLILIVGIVSLGLGVGAGFMISSNTAKPSTPTTPTPEVAESTETSEAGYTFKIEDGWTPTTVSDKLVITNKDEDVTVRFTTNNGSFSNINTSNIEVSLSTKEGYTDITTQKTTIGERDVVIVSAKNNNLFVQYYYTAHDVEKIIFVTVVYESEEAKEKNEEKVKSIIESVKYTNETQNAIEATNPYSQIYDDSIYLYIDSFAD